ncbi:hypothetical protein OF83DRAFT_1158929 [Amylostereum chailletii]|nr:hypothetical protein OF83DRAFT_1158929 [Amylostereum chailletii]
MELATNLQAVFDAHTVVNGQARGGNQKAVYLIGGGFFSPSALIHSTLHRPLVALMNALRELFFYIYTDEELLRRFPASMVEEGSRVLDTAEQFTKVFREHLEVDGWPEDDGAVDQLRPELLPTELGTTTVVSNKKRKSESEHEGRFPKARKHSEHSSVSAALPPVTEGQQH